MVRYYTRVSNALLRSIYDASVLVEGFRYCRTRAVYHDSAVLEFEDDNAPQEFEGMFVTPIFQSTYDENGEHKVTIMTRMLDVNQEWRLDPTWTDVTEIIEQGSFETGKYDE